MKKLFILLFCILSLTIFSQSSVYKPFCDNPSWTTVTGNFGLINYTSYQYELDSTIGLNSYKKIRGVNIPSSYVLLREDIPLKKIYRFDITNSVEYLFIDFNLNVGSTFGLSFGNSLSVMTTSVSVKDSILINGQYHNYLEFPMNPPVYLSGFRFIEGILAFSNPMYPRFHPSDPQTELVCECKNGQYYYNNPNSFYMCQVSCIPTKIAENNFVNEKSFNVFPNPSVNLIFIKGEIDLRGKKYVIFDYTGKEVLSNNYNSEKGIDVYSLKSGIYTLSVSNSFMKFIKIN